MAADPINHNDPLLLPFLRAADESELQQQSDQVIGQVSPTISRVLKQQRRAIGTDSQELYQEVVVKLLEQLHGLRSGTKRNPISNLLGYVVQVTANACKKTFRQSAKEQNSNSSVALADALVAAPDANHETQFAAREELLLVWQRATEELSTEQLRVFLFGWKGLLDQLSDMPDVASIREIAAALRMDANSVISIRDQSSAIINAQIAERLGMKLNRFYKLRRQVEEWLKEIKFDG
ncbi:MAG: sigma-70 family RNA polymerase sigma factor [Pyrinomonadaceae bacterium]|nr:sigma-70 family RNA polymerase sigma factor [Pyrinomonadaceae bacterium]